MEGVELGLKRNERVRRMRSVFTHYVEGLGPGKPPPSQESFETLWRTLKAAVASELKKRGLWTLPPSYLGVYGWSRWSEPAAGPAATDALDELLADCYTFIFIDRQRSLSNQLKVKDNIDGLIFLAIRNFLHDVQRRCDPLGHRTFELLRQAVRRLLAAGELERIDGSKKVASDTLLQVGGGDLHEPSSMAELEEPIAGWCDALLPDLLQARGTTVQKVLRELEGHFRALPKAGIRTFRFGDLVSCFTPQIRSRWGALYAWTQGETAFEDGKEGLLELVRCIRPEAAIEERYDQAKLDTFIQKEISRISGAKDRRYLALLWSFLRAYASEPGEILPSQRQLAKVLGIPRNRLPHLLQSLGTLMLAFREAKKPPAAVIDP